MIGILIVTHKSLGDALIEATESVCKKKLENVSAMSIDMTENADVLRDRVKNAVRLLDQGNGVLILTDMFGGTPSNISYSLLEEGRVEVLSGVNLPAVIKAVETREKEDIKTLAEIVESFGIRAISPAETLIQNKDKIRIMIVAYNNLGRALLETTEFVMGKKLETISALTVDVNENIEDLKLSVKKAIHAIDESDGVLVLTDLPDGPLFDIANTLKEERRIEALSGVNLPTVIKAVNAGKKEDLKTLAETVKIYGKRSISLASALLKGNKKSEKDKSKSKTKIKSPK